MFAWTGAIEDVFIFVLRAKLPPLLCKTNITSLRVWEYDSSLCKLAENSSLPLLGPGHSGIVGNELSDNMVGMAEILFLMALRQLLGSQVFLS